MSGLFKRARAYRTRIELLGEDMGQDDFVLDIPDDERRNVLSGIDSMLRDDKIRLDEGALRFNPKKRAYVLPLILNLGAILILAVGAFVLLRVFDKGESNILESTAELSSAEGRILDRLKRESEAELGAKDREIADVRSMLADLEEQQSLLAAETEAAIAESEQALRRQFEADLSAERARLSDEGVSGSELSSALSEYETQVREQFEVDLGAARDAAEAEELRALAEIENQRAEYETLIAAADADRTRIQEELDTRNAELDGLEAERLARTEQAGEAALELQALQSNSEANQLITDQILALYTAVGTSRRQGDADSALDALDSLESYLNEEGIRSSSVVADRLETDEFLIGALRRLVSLESGGEVSPEPPQVADDGSAEVLGAISAGARAGLRLSVNGDTEGARQAWLDAFSAVPELQEAFQTALEDTGEGAAVSAGVVAGAAAAGAAELAAARNEGLAQGRAEARTEAEGDINTARDEGFLSGRQAGLDEAAAIIAGLQERLDLVKRRIGELAARYSAALNSSESEEQSSRDRLVELLETKLAIKSGLDENLHETLDDYTDAAGGIMETDGREAVYTEIVEFLSALSTSLAE